MDTKDKEAQSNQLHNVISSMTDRLAGSIFILPTVLALLFLSIFPLVISLYLSFAKFDIAPGGFKFTFVGLKNYKELFTGSEGDHFLGAFAPSDLWIWLIFAGIVFVLASLLVNYLMGGRVSFTGFLGRVLLHLGLSLFAWVLIHTLWVGGR